MAAGSINPFEKHIEKAVLGASFLFLLIVVLLYGLRSPNRIEYGGQKVGPEELIQAIARDAENLQAALRKAQPPVVEVPDYSEQLRQQHAAGIFAEQEGPVLPKQLPLAAEFGRPIPALEDEEAAGKDVVLVTPLAPTAPAVRVGRSLAIRQPVRLGAPQPSEGEKKEPEKPPEPTEVAWVSVAAYFDRKEQEAAMARAGYAPAYARAYVAGLQVQRQELLADGQWSGWVEVDSPAMPRLDIPAPLFDEVTGSVLNKAEINRAFGLVRANQALLIQPPFYPVVAGDEWRTPPLEGHQEKAPAGKRVAVDAKKKPEQKREPKPAAPGPRPRTGGGVVDTGGGVGEGPAQPKAGAPDERTAARERAQQDLQAARKAYKESRDDEAMQSANRVLSNEHATAAEKREARKIVNSIELVRKQQAKPGPKPAPAGAQPSPLAEDSAGEVVMAVAGRRPAAAGAEGTKTPATEQKLLAHPEDPGKIAIWFHDDTVEPGKTYRYRMRVRLWNRYFGRPKALRNPEQARQVLLAGEWSPPSDPVCAPASTRFFLASADPENRAARVDVWKWHKGGWHKASFTVGIGDVIGSAQTVDSGILDRQTLKELKETIDFSTGAVVLDIRFDEPVLVRSTGTRGEFTLRETPSLVLVYLDPADGQVKQRWQALDRSDPFLLERKREGEEL